MEPFSIDNNLIACLRKYKAVTPNAIANDLAKYNIIVSSDSEMAIVRLRRALDIMLRSIALMNNITPGTKPIEQLLNEINKINIMPNITQRHCKVIKEFGNLAAHGGDDISDGLEQNELTIQEANICAESISSVTQWYLTAIAPNIQEEISFTIVSGTHVTKDMIDQSIEIDTLIYPPELRGVRERCYAWHDKNPDIYTMILDTHTRKVIGYINSMPLDKEFYEQLLKGEMIDVAISPDYIRSYDLPDFYYLYFASIGIHPSYQNSNAFKVLYNAFIEKLLQLARKEVFMIEILADAVSNEGTRLCKYVGMSEISKTSHNSAIFKVTLLPPSLRITTSAGKNLLSFYKSKYEDFKELF